MTADSAPRDIVLYDTTLRDGLGMEGLSLSLEDKLIITSRLDDLGVHYIEGGYPGSNPKDAEFFQRARTLELKHSKVVAFGSTRRVGGDTASDPALLAVLRAETPAITLVGKSSAAQVREVLGDHRGGEPRDDRGLHPPARGGRPRGHLRTRSTSSTATRTTPRTRSRRCAWRNAPAHPP